MEFVLKMLITSAYRPSILDMYMERSSYINMILLFSVQTIFENVLVWTIKYENLNILHLYQFFPISSVI